MSLLEENQKKHDRLWEDWPVQLGAEIDTISKNFKRLEVQNREDESLSRSKEIFDFILLQKETNQKMDTKIIRNNDAIHQKLKYLENLFQKVDYERFDELSKSMEKIERWSVNREKDFGELLKEYKVVKGLFKGIASSTNNDEDNIPQNVMRNEIISLKIIQDSLDSDFSKIKEELSWIKTKVLSPPTELNKDSLLGTKNSASNIIQLLRSDMSLMKATLESKIDSLQVQPSKIPSSPLAQNFIKAWISFYMLSIRDSLCISKDALKSFTWLMHFSVFFDTQTFSEFKRLITVISSEDTSVKGYLADEVGKYLLESPPSGRNIQILSSFLQVPALQSNVAESSRVWLLDSLEDESRYIDCLTSLATYSSDSSKQAITSHIKVRALFSNMSSSPLQKLTLAHSLCPHLSSSLSRQYPFLVFQLSQICSVSNSSPRSSGSKREILRSSMLVTPPLPNFS